jgi:hypothetical protein
MTFRPGDYCVNCDKQYQHHVDEKCPFEASTFKKREGFVSYQEQGIGIGNIGAIQKVQFFDVSVVHAPYIPSVEQDVAQPPQKEPHEPVDEEPERLGRSNP